MAKLIVVDSDAIFAIYNPNDSLNKEAIQTFQKLISQGYQFIYPTTVIFEVISLFQRVLPSPAVTKKLINLIRDDQLLIYAVDNQILKESVELFDPKGSKKNTLVDCSVIAVAKKIKAKAVFAYDDFYLKQGITLAGKLVKG